MTSHTIIERTDLSDEEIAAYGQWVAEAFGTNKDVGGLAYWGPYEEHPERWVEGWTHILSSSRGQGRFFTDADNRAIMVCFNPGKSFDAKMQGSKTREALMKEDPRLAHFTDNELSAQRAKLTEELYPGGAHKNTFNVNDLVVKPGHQRQGLAQALLKHAQQVADDLQVPCTIEAPMAKAALYKKYGFELAGTTLIKHPIPERSFTEHMLVRQPQKSV